MATEPYTLSDRRDIPGLEMHTNEHIKGVINATLVVLEDVEKRYPTGYAT